MGRPARGGGPAVLRTALLVLLAERESHGYDLASRLAELGLAPDTAALYRMLRSMDHRGELCSAWDASSHGPARRVYALTDEGRGRLQRALDGIEAHSLTIDRLLRRSRRRAGSRAATAAER
ncbi:MAG: PadR family transcriptional regulator [Actinomycetota bacterium]|nr:PadR family transcriptional regulator [Actinomycetota bacterium]